MSPDVISAIIKMRAEVLYIANELEGLDEVAPKQRIRQARQMASRLKTIISAHDVVDACKRERQSTP